VKADTLDSQGPASKGEVGGTVSLSESCDARQEQTLLGEFFEDGGAFVAETLSAGLMVFLAREIHRPVRPVDGLSGEDGDVRLATAYSDANRTPIRFEVGQRSDSKRTVFRLKSDSRPD
jgi:hypothetical protein